MQSTIKIEVNETTKMFRVVDTTDYAAQGVSLSALAAKVLGTVRFNGSIIYQKLLVGDPLVNLQGGATTSAWVACPLDSSNNPSYGVYTITDYSVRTALDEELCSAVIAGASGAGGFTLEDLDLTNVLADGDTIVISDSLASNSGTKTVASVTLASGDTTIYVDQTVNAETPVASSKVNFDITKVTGSATATYAGCTKIIPSFTFDSDCDYGLYGRLSVVDTASIGTQEVVSRLLTLKYPSWKDTADVTSDEGGIVLDALSTGTWTVLNAYTLTYSSGDLLVTYNASVEDERKVSCAGTLCGLLPCIQNLWNVHSAAVKTGVSPYQFFVDGVLLNYVQAVEYKKCGEYEKYQERVKAIDELLDASGCECSCCDNDALYDVVNAAAGQPSVIEELQAEIDALTARMDEAEENIVSLGNEQEVLNQGLTTTNQVIDEITALIVLVKAGLLNQSGTNIPVYTPSSDSQVDGMTFTRLGAGSYRITFESPFDSSKVFPFLDTTNFLKSVRIYTESNTQIRIITYDTATGVPEDSVLLDSKLLIQFYP